MSGRDAVLEIMLGSTRSIQGSYRLCGQILRALSSKNEQGTHEWHRGRRGKTRSRALLPLPKQEYVNG
jgi:hypothetical protein